MARIKIRNLPSDVTVSKGEMKNIIGGTFCFLPFPFAIKRLLSGAIVTYESSTEGAGYQEEMTGLHVDQDDSIKEMWSDDD